jgi:hypothetical protein
MAYAGLRATAVPLHCRSNRARAICDLDTCHKLARIVYHLLGTKEAYNESVFHKSEADTIRRAEYRLRRQAAQLGFQVIPAETG